MVAPSVAKSINNVAPICLFPYVCRLPCQHIILQSKVTTVKYLKQWPMSDFFALKGNFLWVVALYKIPQQKGIFSSSFDIYVYEELTVSIF
jgi:hypothetical protein